ncbi:cilia- and flagella-associated protein 251 [Podarcis raffonei]|uniref:cilia- and flagella-associated protein 251 n=1 Tax=Podarcis raffonei TaxID=65483 RepID=UPI002329607A|nr:cilia- and flagella-associated protein 251 [Podarcis raffonei]
MEEDTNETEPPSQGTKGSDEATEAPREEMEVVGAAMDSEPSLQSQPSPQPQISAEPMEVTFDREAPVQASQDVLPAETSSSPTLLETSNDIAATSLPGEIAAKQPSEEEEPGVPEDETSSKKTQESPARKAAAADNQGAGPAPEAESVAGAEEERGLMRTQSVARREEAGSPREAAVSFREPLASGQAASSASSGGPGSPATKAEAEVSHEVNAALGGTGPSSEDERASRETEVKTAQGESGPSQAPTAASSLTPAEGQEESAVSSALPGMTLEETSRPLSVHPLSLSWVFGYNSELPVFNLLDEDYRVILYVSSHTAVIHDVLRNRQYLLQGHTDCISCICVSEDRRWIATADRGPQSMVTVWDGYSAIPVHTIFDSHPEGGVCAIAISHDSKFLATIGAGEVQKVCIWRWTSPETKPVCSVEIQPQFGFQDYIAFNSRYHNELVSNSKIQVIFYIWNADILNYHAPPLTDKSFNKVVGIFSQTIFHFSSTQAITGTMEGKLVVWDAVCPPSKSSAVCVKPYNMKAIKLVHLQRDGITVLAITDKNFVTCDVKGHVKFYDGDLQLLHWYSQFKLGRIRSISFSKKPMCPEDTTKFPTSCTLAGLPFVVRNFIISTADALVIHVKTEGTKVSKCLEEPKEAVHAVSCHPSKPLMAKGSFCGLLKVWNYKINKYLISRIFKGESIQSLCYDSSGSLLAAGFIDGSVYILDSISLENDCPEPFRYSSTPITVMSFSPDSQYLATADENISLNLYKQTMVEGKKVWDRLAALHSHYKPIRTILFGVHLDSDEPWLLTLGEDRLLVEYDLEKSVKDELVVIRRDRIEQHAVPKCITWYPPLTTEYFFLTANDQYKMKMYNVTTRLCRKTVVGPAYGSPLEKILVLPLAEGHDPQRRSLAYITKDKVGLQILPIDGNPHKSSAFICHPSGVTNLECSYDGCHLFTTGGNDLTVMKWDINLVALEAASFLGGEDLIPFYNLLEGGREGEFFKELEDYFYYAQLRHQGIDTMEPRKVSTHIPLEQIPFVMRAMGFYPSEEQIEDMLNEVKFSEYLETGMQVTDINLGDFIKLYVNHRPAFGLSLKEIENAFQVLGYENENSEVAISRDELLLLLQQRGEHFTEEELAECLTTLLGANPEGGRSEVGTYDATGADAFIEEEIPEEITATHFITDILDLPIPEPRLTETETTKTTNEPESGSSTLIIKS